jgi:hypothetical protein
VDGAVVGSVEVRGLARGRIAVKAREGLFEGIELEVTVELLWWWWIGFGGDGVGGSSMCETWMSGDLVRLLLRFCVGLYVLVLLTSPLSDSDQREAPPPKNQREGPERRGQLERRWLMCESGARQPSATQLVPETVA